MNPPGYTWQCGLKYTDIKLQTLQNNELILSLKNKTLGGKSSVIDDRYLKSEENEKVLYIDAIDFNGWAMSESLPYD